MTSETRQETGRRVDGTPSRLRSLADFYPDGILGATREGVVTILNAQGAALLGVDAAEALGLPLADVLKLLDQDGRTWLEVNRPFESISIVRGVPEQPNGKGALALQTGYRPRVDKLDAGCDALVEA